MRTDGRKGRHDKANSFFFFCSFAKQSRTSRNRFYVLENTIMLTLIRNNKISVLEYPVTWRRNISKDSNMYVRL
jgi:hypothetical protein